MNPAAILQDISQAIAKTSLVARLIGGEERTITIIIGLPRHAAKKAGDSSSTANISFAGSAVTRKMRDNHRLWVMATKSTELGQSYTDWSK